MIPMIYSNIRCKVKKISTGSPVKLSCNIHTDTHFRNESFYAWSKLFYFISSNFQLLCMIQSCSKRKKTYNLVLVFVELFCWTISSDFWRVYYIYLNYLLMDSEYYQKSSYLYSRLHVRDDYVYLRDNNDYCLDFDYV